jgi:hypothetical protein
MASRRTLTNTVQWQVENVSLRHEMLFFNIRHWIVAEKTLFIAARVRPNKAQLRLNGCLQAGAIVSILRSSTEPYVNVKIVLFHELLSDQELQKPTE